MLQDLTTYLFNTKKAPYCLCLFSLPNIIHCQTYLPLFFLQRVNFHDPGTFRIILIPSIWLTSSGIDKDSDTQRALHRPTECKTWKNSIIIRKVTARSFQKGRVQYEVFRGRSNIFVRNIVHGETTALSKDYPHRKWFTECYKEMNFAPICSEVSSSGIPGP